MIEAITTVMNIVIVGDGIMTDAIATRTIIILLAIPIDATRTRAIMEVVIPGGQCL